MTLSFISRVFSKEMAFSDPFWVFWSWSGIEILPLGTAADFSLEVSRCLLWGEREVTAIAESLYGLKFSFILFVVFYLETGTISCILSFALPHSLMAKSGCCQPVKGIAHAG